MGTVLSLRNLVGMQEEKCRGAGRNCLPLFTSKLNFGWIILILHLWSNLLPSYISLIQWNKFNQHV